MDIVSEVADKIYMIAHYPENSVYCFQAFFIDGERPTLIEPGPANFIPRVVDGLHQLGYDASLLSYIIPTHIHADHCGGAGQLAQQAPNARIIAHETGAKHLTDPTRMMEATRASWGEDFDSQIGPALPVPWERIEVVRGGETIPLGKRNLSIVHTPGHAKHHICLYDAEDGTLFAGESLGYLMPGDEIMLLPIVSPPIFDIYQVTDTIDRLRRLNPSTILFSHRGVSHDAARCIAVAQESVNTWGDVILQALQNGENPEQIKARLASIVEKLQPGRSPQFSRFIDWATTGYTGYFTRQGTIPG